MQSCVEWAKKDTFFLSFYSHSLTYTLNFILGGLWVLLQCVAVVWVILTDTSIVLAAADNRRHQIAVEYCHTITLIYSEITNINSVPIQSFDLGKPVTSSVVNMLFSRSSCVFFSFSQRFSKCPKSKRLKSVFVCIIIEKNLMTAQHKSRTSVYDDPSITLNSLSLRKEVIKLTT